MGGSGAWMVKDGWRVGIDFPPCGEAATELWEVGSGGKPINNLGGGKWGLVGKGAPTWQRTDAVHLVEGGGVGW